MPPFDEFFRGSLPSLRDAPLYRPNPTYGNPQWEARALGVLILRLSPFKDVERSTPHLFLSREVRRGVPGSFVDTAFLPPAGDRAALEESGLPLIIGTQSHRPLSDFDLLLVSNSCVPELVNLPYLFLHSGVPLWASERGARWPAVILGGSSSAAAHGVVKENGDCMADALFFGEGEGAVARIVSLWKEMSALAKAERLSAIAGQIDGLWPAGDLSRTVKRAVSSEPPLAAAGLPYPLLPGQEAGSARLEITKGCPCLCSFCFEGFDRKPFRQLPVEALLAEARELKAAGGAETLEVSSFNFNTHEGLVELLLGLSRIFLRVNAMSQRADILARTSGLLDVETAAGKRSYTIGIEGVSEAKRRFLHKSLEEKDISRIVEALVKKKVREVKLFYLLTGRETTEDFEELSAFVRRLKDLCRAAERAPRFIFSFGLLVRMPFTPLRYDGLILEEKEWRPRIGRAKSICQTNGFEFRLAAGMLDYRLTQVLAAGGYAVTRLVERLASRGAVYDGRFPPQAGEILDEWLSRNGEEAKDLQAEKPEGFPFAFGFLETERERSSLYERYQQAKAGIDEGYCRRGNPRGCAQCLGCTMSGPSRPKEAARTGASGGAGGATRAAASGDSRTPGAAARPIKAAPAGFAGNSRAPGAPPTAAFHASRPVRAAEALAALERQKARLNPLFARVTIPREAAAARSEWLNAVLLRGFLDLCPRELENVLRVREVVVSPWLGPAFAGSWFGCGIVEIVAWDRQKLEAALSVPFGAQGNPSAPRFQLLAPGEISAGSFSSIALALELPLELFPKADEAIGEALRATHTAFTTERSVDGYRMIVSEKAKKRKGLLDARYRMNGESLRLELAAGPKLEAGALFSRFPNPRASAGAVIEVLDLVL